MAKSPVIDQTVVLIKTEVLLDGEAVQDHYILNYINVRKQINRITTAEIAYYDGDPAKQEFDFIKEYKDKIKPGKELEIKAGYEKDGTKTIFKGIITGVSIKVQDERRSKVIVSAADKCVLMSERRISKEWKGVKDSAVVNEICGEYQVEKETIDTDVTHKKLIQYNTTDWDFIVSRAEANERVIITDENKLRFIEPGKNSSPTWQCFYGEDFYSMNLKVDGFSQFQKVKCASWDPNSQALVEQPSEEPTLPDISDFKGPDLAGSLQKKEYKMHSSGQMPSEEVGAWAKSSLLKSRLARIKGTILFQGVNDIKIDDVIEINKTQGLFDGKAYVSGIEHRVEESNFITEVTVGIDNRWFIEETPSITQAHSASLMPGVKGLLIGTVKAVTQDPDEEYRVKIKIPFIDESDIWARLSNFYSSKEFGGFFYPEIDDEVIVGFLSGDPRYPIILGSVYSKVNKPPEFPDVPEQDTEHNTYNYTDFNASAEKMQAIVTKNKLKISLLDDKKVIVLETPGGRTIFLDDEKKKIFIEDEFKNTMEMFDEGFRFKSKKNFVVEVDGDIEMTAKQNIKTKSTKDTSMEGMNISKKATSKYSAEGMQSEVKGTTSATLDGGMTTVSGKGSTVVKSNGQTSVTGTMVMIN